MFFCKKHLVGTVKILFNLTKRSGRGAHAAYTVFSKQNLNRQLKAVRKNVINCNNQLLFNKRYHNIPVFTDYSSDLLLPAGFLHNLYYFIFYSFSFTFELVHKF